MIYRNKKLRDLANKCPECMSCGKYNTGGILVAAHSNWHGKGIGLKAPDNLVAFICTDPCHTEIDNGKNLTREERKDRWLKAYFNTQTWLYESGHIQIV